MVSQQGSFIKLITSNWYYKMCLLKGNYFDLFVADFYMGAFSCTYVKSI